MFHEEKAHLRPLPATHFRFFRQGTRTVDDAGLVQVEGSYYAALPAPVHSQVTVRSYDRGIEILDAAGQLLRRHEKASRKGTFTLDTGDRLFNPSRETARLLAKAQRIGPHTAAFAQALFARLGRPGQRALYGLTSLARTHPREDIEAACGRLLAGHCFSYAALKRVLERAHLGGPDAEESAPLTQSGPTIRPVAEYHAFWQSHARTQELPHAHVDPRA